MNPCKVNGFAPDETEPTTIIGALAVVGLIVLRERRRLTFLRGK